MPNDFAKFDQNASVEEKLRILGQNAKALNDLQKEIDNPSLGIVVKTGVMPEEDDLIDFVPAVYERPVPVDKDFAIFFERLSSLAIDDDFETNLFMLINPKDYRFNNFIAMSKLKIYESLALLSNMAYEDADVDIEETLAYIHELQALFNALDEVMEEKELADESTSTLNDLFFLQNGDKINFYESVDKDITTDFYDRILAVLESLRNGYFKSVKYLGDKKFFETRSDLLRVLFAKIGPNKFLILDVFLKKKKSSIEYWDRMFALRDTLAMVRSYYVGIAKSPEEIQKHMNYYMDIIEFLKNKKRGI